MPGGSLETPRCHRRNETRRGHGDETTKKTSVVGVVVVVVVGFLHPRQFP